jgi:hypothetical protein
MKKTALLCVAVVCCLASAAEAKKVFLSVFRNPQVDGYGLDYCREWTLNCGQAAADAFCRTKGMSATGFKVAENNQTTRVINGRHICDAEFCDRISEVTCKGVTYPEGTLFANPKIDGHALDWCRDWGANCGEPAAQAFCVSKGFSTLLNYAVAFDSPPTKVIGSGQICNETGCDRITKVICK